LGHLVYETEYLFLKGVQVMKGETRARKSSLKYW
jgi:hypothetical protein